jgi:hypothetical protein
MAKPEPSNVVEIDTVRAQLENARAENDMLRASIDELRGMVAALQAAPQPAPILAPQSAPVAVQPAPVAPQPAPAGDVLATLQAIERHSLVQARALALIQRALDLLMQMAAAQLERPRADG